MVFLLEVLAAPTRVAQEHTVMIAHVEQHLSTGKL